MEKSIRSLLLRSIVPTDVNLTVKPILSHVILFQALWNYIIDSGNVIGALGEDEADYISAHILEYLGMFMFTDLVPDFS